MPFRSTTKFATFLSGYVVFLCIAAMAFLAIEEESEMRSLRRHKEVKNEFLAKYPCVNYSDLEGLLRYFENEIKTGFSVTNNISGWYFGQSVFFVTTIVTTIGYGDMTPVTVSGKVFTLLFALVGIPFTLSVLSAFVDRLLIPTNTLLLWMKKKAGSSHHKFTIRILHLLVILTIVFVFALMLPAVIFHLIEPEWSILDSVYYCFMSLTSIGFGDYTPGDSWKNSLKFRTYRTWYNIIVSVYLFAGIIAMMLALAIFYNIPQLNLGLLYTVNEPEVFEDDDEERDIGAFSLTDEEVSRQPKKDISKKAVKISEQDRTKLTN